MDFVDDEFGLTTVVSSIAGKTFSTQATCTIQNHLQMLMIQQMQE
jgi:hypothetical protein